MVLLLHTPPAPPIPPAPLSVQPHFDWMLARPDGSDSSALVTFRVLERPDTALRVGLHLERLADHRREYLQYEGPLTANRGSVARIASGVCHIRSLDEARMDVDLCWNAHAHGRRVLIEAQQHSAMWVVRTVVTLTDTDRR